jgi:outer membrane protein TolC
MRATAWLAPWIAAAAAAQAPLTLDEAVRIAETEAFDIRVARSALAKAEGNERTARGAFGPTVSVDGSYVRNEFTGLSGPGGGFFRNETKDIGVSLVQRIDISGASRAALRAARAQKAAARAAYDAEVSRIRDEARRSYFDVLLAATLVTVREEAVTAAVRRLASARRRFEEGVVSRFDVLRLETDLKRSEEGVIQSKGSLATAKQALNNLLARSVYTPFEAVDVAEMPPPQGPDEQLVATAVQNRPEVRQAKAVADALDQAAEIERRGLRPSLGLSASHTRSIAPGAGSPTATTTGALQLSWPLFDSGITRGRVDSAEEDALQARFRAEQAVLGVGLDVLSAATRYRTAVDAYRTAVQARTLAEEALRLAEVSYSEQVGTLLDVITAQSELTAAKGAAASARFAAWQAFSQLLRATGEPVKEEGQ